MREDFTYIQIQVNLPQEALYIKFKNGKLRLIAYASKRLPEAVRSYLITELELCGLAINIVSFLHLLKRVDLFAGHQGVIKTYLTISTNFFIPNLIHYLRSYIKGCHICQIMHNDKLLTGSCKLELILNYRPLSRLSMDLKVMP